MSRQSPDFTPLQWEFLSLIEAFNEPVSIDVIGTLVPLPPGEFLDLLRKCDSNQWIHRSEDDLFGFSSEVPESVQSRLEKINSREKISKVIDLIEKNNLLAKVAPSAFSRLLQKSGNGKKAVRLEIDLAIDALKSGNREIAKRHITVIESLLPSMDEPLTTDDWFIPAAIELSQYCLARMVGFNQLFNLLEKAIVLAEKIGDERSWTLAHFLIGKASWGADRPKEAVSFLSKAKAKAEALGDHDMLTQSSGYIGIYYFIKGLHDKAVSYLETAVQIAEDNEAYATNYEAPLLLAYCDVDRGEFHRAIGKIDFFWHCALKSEDYYIAALYRAVLGIILWLIRKREEAVFHLEGSQTDALATQNMPAYWTSLYGLSSLYLSEGNIEKGLTLLNQAIQVAEKNSMKHQVFHSVFLESYLIVEQAGWELPHGWRVDELFKRIMDEPNIHLQGVALRLRAARSMVNGKALDRVIKDLNDSEALIRECGDPVELAKTQLEKARYYLRKKENENARELAYEAYQGMSGYSEIFFPDDLRFLLKSAKSQVASQKKPDDIIEPVVQMLEELIPGPSHVREWDTLLSALSRFFRAERSGLFLFSNRTPKKFELKAARNLSYAIVQADHFRDNLAVIFKSVHERKPTVIQSEDAACRAGGKKSLSVLCLPLIVNQSVLGVLYFDNSYLGNCFDFIKTPTLKRLGHYLTNIIEKYIQYGQSHKMTEPTATEKSIQSVLSHGSEFIAKDPKMIHILNQAKRQAKSDASVLILGDTGVGKEVLARWIHRNSLRNQKPFVVVDLTTIPENLMESELFGHEKGAFTGADSQKVGRVELADQGTLFIDEIGEVSRDLQIKLLRLLQEKSFMRIGGTKTFTSDFRLITATNRNLAEEITAGRFREDLYYRLNVLALTIPPLRQRTKDILPLARYYLARYTKKYNMSIAALTVDQEASMVGYNWPGNVRELKNVIERAVIVSENDQLEFNFSAQPVCSEDNPFFDLPTLDEVQRRYIRFVLDRTQGKIGGPGGAAEILGMKRTSVNSRIKRLGLGLVRK